MSSPSDLVSGAFSIAQTYASDAKAQMASFTNALSSSLFTVPTVDVSFQPIEAPSSQPVPERPLGMDEIEPEFQWDRDGEIALDKPASLTLTDPTLVIDDFTEAAPTITLPDAPVLDFGTAPTVPDVGTVTVPDAPTIDVVATPEYLAISVPTFSGVDVHTDLQPAAAPTLTLVEPTAFTYTPNAAYTDDLLTALQALLTARLQGGTGLAPAVEQALWDRARERELSTALANEADILRTSEGLGFTLPAGVTADQLRQAQRDTAAKVAGLSRDIAIKQADLEQENLKQAIAEGITLESKLIDQALELEKLAFEAAKELADNAVSIYNSQVDKYKALVTAYTAYVQAYGAIIDAEKLKLAEYQSALEGEKIKSEVNVTLVEQYKATIDAQMSRVKIFEAQVGAAQTLMALEKTKLEAAGEQIRAYVAGINAETAKVEAYKAGVEAAKTTIDIYAVKADVFKAKVGAQAERSRAEMSFYEGNVRAYEARWRAWGERVRGEASRFQALATKFGALVEGYKADVGAMEAVSNQDIKRWEVAIKQYEAQTTYTMAGQKINADIVQTNASRILDAAKVGAQTYSQLAAAAYGLFHAGANVSGSSGMSVSYSYSNDTLDAPPSVTSV